MKKRKILNTLLAIISIIVLLALAYFFYLSSEKEVQYLYALDGDSIMLKIEGKEQEVRLLAIDCPELNTPFGEQARNYTDRLLKNAKKIKIEKDIASEEYDKYNRLLVWLFVDDELLQYKLIEEGLAKSRYIYADYMYKQGIFDLQEIAKNKKVGLWSLDQ